MSKPDLFDDEMMTHDDHLADLLDQLFARQTNGCLQEKVSFQTCSNTKSQSSK